MDQDLQVGDRGSRLGSELVLVLVVLPMFYVALLGPAVRMYDASPKPIQKAIEAIYAPLEWLDDQLPGNPLRKYVEMWEP